MVLGGNFGYTGKQGTTAGEMEKSIFYYELQIFGIVRYYIGVLEEVAHNSTAA